jgi:hypothetical protein
VQVATHAWNSFAGVDGLSGMQLSAHCSHSPAFGACMKAIRCGWQSASDAHPQHVSHCGSLCVPGVPVVQVPPLPVDALVELALEADTLALDTETVVLDAETPVVTPVEPDVPFAAWQLAVQLA